MKIFEKQLNFLIGLIVLGNLYYLAPIVGLSKEIVLISLVFISLFFSIIRFSRRLFNLLFARLAISFVVLSIIFFLINSLLTNYSPAVNNLIRVIWYLSFFAWTYQLYQNDKELSAIIIRWTTVILIIVGIISFFEYYYYNLFWQFIMEDHRDLTTKVRLAGTYIDANSFAGALATYLFIFMKTNKRNIFNWVYFWLLLF